MRKINFKTILKIYYTQGINDVYEFVNRYSFIPIDSVSSLIYKHKLDKEKIEEIIKNNVENDK